VEQEQPSLRDRQRTQIRADIRRAAFRLFAARGFDAVTTEEIAAAAGVSPRTFFRHVPNKEELLLGPVRHGGSAIISLLEQRPSREAPDVALASAIAARAGAFERADSEGWREAILVAPYLLGKVTMLGHEDKDRLVKLTAVRMRTDPNTDARPGLLVHLAFAAADFGFQQWVRDFAGDHRPLQRYVSDALDAIKHPRWRQRPVTT
jgi:AcrR family transcriptional regulator